MRRAKQKKIWCCADNTKKPYNPITGDFAKSNDCSTWVDFETALDAMERGEYPYLGMFCADDYVFIDLDDCISPENSLFREDIDTSYQQSIYKLFQNTYVEYSKSNTGLHIIAKVSDKSKLTSIRTENVELYVKERFFVMTLNSAGDSEDIIPADNEVAWLYNSLLQSRGGENVPQTYKAHGVCKDAKKALKKAMSDPIFERYYNRLQMPSENESENDLGFIEKAAFYFSRDPDAIFDMLINSPYFSAKDDAHKDKFLKRNDYFVRTFERANACVNSAWGEYVDMAKDLPDYITISKHGNVKFNDIVFARSFLVDNPYYYSRGRFYTKDGTIVDPEIIRKVINTILIQYELDDMANKITKVMNNIKDMAKVAIDRPEEDVIRLQSGVKLRLTKDGIEQSFDDSFSIHRLPVVYEPTADCPTWLSLVDSLFYEEDIPVLQEYLGYCLLPTTKAQMSLFILGNGGEGKSTLIGAFTKMLGNTSKAVELAQATKANSNEARFFASNAEGKLVIYDDDVSIDKIEDTTLFKKLVTAETMVVERKYQENYETVLYARIIGCSNARFTAKFDRSDGFYRRLIQIKVKPKAYETKNVELSRELAGELSGIFNWCLAGALRLVRNGFVFTFSHNVAYQRELAREESNSLLMFMRDDDWIVFKEDGVCSVEKFFLGYKAWCKQQGELPYCGGRRKSAKEFLEQKFGIICKRGRIAEGNVWYFKGLEMAYSGVLLNVE